LLARAEGHSDFARPLALCAGVASATTALGVIPLDLSLLAGHGLSIRLMPLTRVNIRTIEPGSRGGAIRSPWSVSNRR
jgi:hypothetical protein